MHPPSTTTSRTPNHRAQRLSIAISTLICLVVQYATSPTQAQDAAERRTIACWGDSLTGGAGAAAGEDYCSVLGQLTGRTTFKAGVGGQTSTEISARMLQRYTSLDADLTIIWAGRNNYKNTLIVVRDIERMVKSLPVGANYLVLEIINGEYPEEHRDHDGYASMANLNSQLQQSYGTHFVPIRKGLAALGSETDELDNKNDIVPRSLRSDRIHLNNIGYYFVAIMLLEFFSKSDFL